MVEPMDEEDGVIGVADNPANRYFDPLTSPTPRTSTDAAPEPVPPPPPAEEPAPPARDPTPPPRPPPPPQYPLSAYLYGHDVGLFAETLEDSDETFVQWAARESHKDKPVRYPTELKKSTLPGHMVRAARFVKDGSYEDKRSVVRARMWRIRMLMDVLFGANVVLILLAVVGMAMALWLRSDDWDTYSQLARWTIAGFTFALLLIPGASVPIFAKLEASEHIFLLWVMLPFYLICFIPALGTGVSALPVDRGVGAEAYATRGMMLLYMSAGGFISALMAMVCIGTSVLVIRRDKEWGVHLNRGKLGVTGWKSQSIKPTDDIDPITRTRHLRWGIDS